MIKTLSIVKYTHCSTIHSIKYDSYQFRRFFFQAQLGSRTLPGGKTLITLFQQGNIALFSHTITTYTINEYNIGNVFLVMKCINSIIVTQIEKNKK